MKHEDLQTLLGEVQKIAQKENKSEKKKEIVKKVVKEKELLEVQKKAQKILDSIQDGKESTKETLTNIMDMIKEDYEHLSPATAVLLFAIGAAFGSALSSKKGD